MSDTPEFRDLVGEGLPPGERERLERVHKMLIEAGPPPELPPELQEVPDGRGNVRGPQSTTLRFPVAYDSANFNGLEIARWDHSDRKAVPVVSANL